MWTIWIFVAPNVYIISSCHIKYLSKEFITAVKCLFRKHFKQVFVCILERAWLPDCFVEAVRGLEGDFRQIWTCRSSFNGSLQGIRLLTAWFLLSTLSAYGLTDEAVLLLRRYLSGREQQIKLNNIASSWSEIKKGVQQGSILGPLLFIVFNKIPSDWCWEENTWQNIDFKCLRYSYQMWRCCQIA